MRAIIIESIQTVKKSVHHGIIHHINQTYRVYYTLMNTLQENNQHDDISHYRNVLAIPT